MNTIQLKAQLISLVCEKLQEKMARQRHAMTEAQKEANSHKGAMSSRYDTFKEEAQALRDGHAQQVQVLAEVTALMQHLQPSLCGQVVLGALVVTDQANYFVTTGLIDDPIMFDGIAYECVSVNAPIMRQMRGKSKGNTVNTPSGPVKILDIL